MPLLKHICRKTVECYCETLYEYIFNRCTSNAKINNRDVDKYSCQRISDHSCKDYVVIRVYDDGKVTDAKMNCLYGWVGL